MQKPRMHELTGAIGLGCYLFCWLVGLACDSMTKKWLWQGEDVMQWLSLFLVMLAHVIIVVAFIRLFKPMNWSKDKLLAIIDLLFFIVTVLYIFFWIFLLAVISAFDFGDAAFT